MPMTGTSVKIVLEAPSHGPPAVVLLIVTIAVGRIAAATSKPIAKPIIFPTSIFYTFYLVKACLNTINGKALCTSNS